MEFTFPHFPRDLLNHKVKLYRMTLSAVVKVAYVGDDISPVYVGGKHVLICTNVSADAYMTPALANREHH
jgi:hypothetical protein